MKYPQLVSSRAVREISDWLIKRLEDLDVEQPGVYSRLLLSLLHTPFKVNAIDILEIPQLKDLKQPYHLLNKNNEELKRLAAVESLMEVSAEENKSNIISLINELHLKLRKIESSCEEGGAAASLIGRSSISIASTSPISSGSKFYKNLKKIKRNHGTENPTKNYYLAFPALSSKKTTATTTTTRRSSPGCNVDETNKDSNNLQLLCWSSLMTKENSPAKDAVRDAVAIVKRPRRQRRYGRYKSKVKNDVQCNAKSSDVYDSAAFSPKAQNGSKKHQRNQFVATTKNVKSQVVDRSNHLSSTGAPWDMDFKGHWEMERDLISEFKNHPSDVKSTNQVEQQAIDDDDDMMLKFLPTKLMDDDPIGDRIVVKAKEPQSISAFQSKFDENVKALWNDVDDPSTHKSFDDCGSNASLVSSFASEKNSLGLFNFNGHQPHHLHHAEVIAPCTNLQSYANSEFAMNQRTYQSSASSVIISPTNVDKFIKSGTNLQSSIWSEGEFTCEPESLIYKDVVDHSNDDAIYKQIKSIGTELKNWQKSCEDDSSDVSLFNHSDVSAFKRFRPYIASTIIRANYHPINTPQSAIFDTSDESDNLLTSEKSHFSPIIDDGHAFVIDDHWDEVKWERTASGGLLHNNKHYMRYKNPNEERPVGIDLNAMEDEVEAEFCVKFVVRVENEKACQTDLNDFLRASHRSLMEINEEYCKRKIYDEYCRGAVDNKWRYHLEDSNDYSLFSVNRVKNNAPKTLHDMLMSSNSSSSSICTITSSSYETPAVDPFESWRSMKIDRGGMFETNHKPACMHSMWEQCITCNLNENDPYEEKSIPANHQLKDELRMDGDEIMNVIQNLYITGDYCDEEEKEEDDDCSDMNHFYVDMLDESMDGEDESKFYEGDDKEEKVIEEPPKEIPHFTPNMFVQQQPDALLELEKFDEITLAKMQWQWDKSVENENNNYLKKLDMIHFSLQKDGCFCLDPNNNCDWFDDDYQSNRKRRHSTCQNMMESKMMGWSQDNEFTCQLKFSKSPSEIIEDSSSCLSEATKMMKMNIGKIMLIANSNCREFDNCKDENGANYYRNILQQQHALIKSLDLARPLTR